MSNYQDMATSVKSAVSGDLQTANRWEKAGQMVSEHYPNAKALEEQKAQFMADCIIPALDKKHGQALALDLPRKGSKEFNEKCSADSTYLAKWEIANQAKKDARAVCTTYFDRIVKYAFPTEKAESTPRTLKVKCNEEINKLIKAVEKSDDCPFDAVAFIKLANQLLTVVNK